MYIYIYIRQPQGATGRRRPGACHSRCSIYLHNQYKNTNTDAAGHPAASVFVFFH